MDTTNNGGPAFPQPEHSAAISPEGMTLRDYYAAHFAAAWVIALGARWKEGGFSDDALLGEANNRGLQQADDMLKAREGRK